MARISSFEEDRFDRKKVADYITKIIENKDEIFNPDEGLVIGIDSAWGTGKTTFLDLWEKQLKEEDMYTIIRYNSWEDDDYDTPIIPISVKLSEMFHESEQIKAKFFTGIKIISSKIAKNVIDKKFGDETFDAIGNLLKKDDIALALEKMSNLETTNNYMNDYEMYKKVKSNIKELLETQTKDKKVIFLIDELDRCRPLYAISLLETIKHYFNIPNIIFVFALDMDQLKHSIATIYGQDMDSYGYIRRFFNHCIKLPTPNIKEYLIHIDCVKMINNDDFLNQLSNLFTDMEATFRDIDVIYSNILILYYLKFSSDEKCSKEKIFSYLFFIALKYKNPNIYELILNHKFSYNDKMIQNTGDKAYFFNSLQTDGNVRKRLTNLENSLNKLEFYEYMNDASRREFFENCLKIESIENSVRDTISSYIQRVIEEIVI